MKGMELMPSLNTIESCKLELHVADGLGYDICVRMDCKMSVPNCKHGGVDAGFMQSKPGGEQLLGILGGVALRRVSEKA
jgi:hypothetical protein